MKKFLGIILMLCLLVVFPLATSSISSVSAASKNTVVILEGAKQNEQEVTVDVNVRENTGITTFVLKIEFDKDVMELKAVDQNKRTALETLDIIWTDKEKNNEFPTVNETGSFIINGDQSGEFVNDYSTGSLMTLTFVIKEGVSDGNYSINLTYDRNKDIEYKNEKGQIVTKNIVTNSVKVSLKESQIDEVITGDQETEDKTMMWVAIGVSGAAVLGGAIAIGIIVAKKKGKWVKL